MRIHTIADGIDIALIAPDRGDFTACITMIADEDRVLLIDSGYERHALAVAAHLGGPDRIAAVVLSHEHEDHTWGCRTLPHADLLVPAGFPGDDLPGRALTVFRDDSELEFGDHVLRSHASPGHSRHHRTTIIDDDIVHAGDLLIYTADGRPAPPYLQDGDALPVHARSLEHLKSLDADVVVPGHGPLLIGERDITAAVDLRLRYLDTLGHADGPVSVTEALTLGDEEISRHDFHDMNLTKLGLA